MKRLAFFGLFLIFYGAVFAQEKGVICDTIVLKSGNKLIASVNEISDAKVTFIKCDSVRWPASWISSEKVERVLFSNGTSIKILDYPTSKKTTGPEIKTSLPVLLFKKRKSFFYSDVFSLAFLTEPNLGYEWRCYKNIGLSFNAGYRFHSAIQSIFNPTTPPSFFLSNHGPQFSLQAKYYLFKDFLFVGSSTRISHFDIIKENFVASIDRYTGIYNLSSQRTDLDLGLTIGITRFTETFNVLFFVSCGIKNTWAKTTYDMIHYKYPYGYSTQNFYAGPILNGYSTSLYIQAGLIFSFFQLQREKDLKKSY